MASITLSQLNVTGSELFQDSESYLDDLNDANAVAVHGGYYGGGFGEYGDFGVKYLEYLVNGYAITSIKHIAKSFSHNPSASASATGGW